MQQIEAYQIDLVSLFRCHLRFSSSLKPLYAIRDVYADFWPLKPLEAP